MLDKIAKGYTNNGMVEKVQIGRDRLFDKIIAVYSCFFLKLLIIYNI